MHGVIFYSVNLRINTFQHTFLYRIEDIDSLKTMLNIFFYLRFFYKLPVWPCSEPIYQARFEDFIYNAKSKTGNCLCIANYPAQQNRSELIYGRIG